MAGDWIKFEHATPDKPEVIQMATALRIDQDAVVGKLLRLWIWADQQTIDGNALSVTSSFVDRITFCPGFADVLRTVGWLEGRDGHLLIPNFERHNGQTAKQRANTAKRVKKSRKRNGATVTESAPKALPEKRREEKRTHTGVCVAHARDEEPPTDSEKLERPPDGPTDWGNEEALFIDLWNACPEGLRGVVRVRGTPPVMSPKDRAVFRDEWPARRDVAMQALAAICGGAIEWDRQPLTIRAFFNEIDSILGGGHARRTSSDRNADRPATRVDGSRDAAAVESRQVSAEEFLASSQAGP